MGKRPLASTAMVRLVNILLAVPALLLAVVAFFALQEILLRFAAPMITGSAGNTVRGNYALVTVRNLWLLVGGALLVGFVIGCLDYCFKHAHKPRTRRLLLRILAVELAIIGLQFVIAG